MTREEAKTILEEVKEFDDSMYQYNSAYLKALDMAIEALDREETVLKALKDVRAEIEDIDGITEIGAQILDEVSGIIDRKIAEVKGE